MQPQRPGFPQFVRLPSEIQDMIFAEAIQRPNIHIVKACRVLIHDNYNANWSLSFSPVPKRQDKSGYRWLADLARVCLRARATVLRATRSHQNKLPFKSLSARIDGNEDLVLVEFATSRSPTLGHLHPLDQLHACRFDEDRVRRQLDMVKKIALKYSWRHPTAIERNCNFRCRNPNPFHVLHNGWRMCPREVFGFLNCLPKLHEVYIILEPQNSRDQQRMLSTYIRNFFTLPPTSPTRLNFAVFHASEGCYIELHPSLCYEWCQDLQNFHPFFLDDHGPVSAMLDVLRTKDFLADTTPGLQPNAQSAFGFRVPPYRMSRAERERLVCKLLVAVPEAEKHGWEGEMGRRVRAFFRA
ncbi:hypothetical protein C8A03DRAFT_19229 [Achaetomium macrosporum]|uniref:2EXR domain-containing protein n=1 Tax=Achaetomium macrosporum TaxID=79813 RepID=A0AAN7H3V9_9PEZI|nr:hypothetical protein C8A03DRAFT_19229 [Achaetomium macrosporum]